jgi:hypothetical protein
MRSVVNLVKVPQWRPTEPELSMMSAISLAPQSADIGMRVGALVGATGALVRYKLPVKRRVGALVTTGFTGFTGLVTVVHTAVTMLVTELFRAAKPDVTSMAFADDGELTHDCTVFLRMFLPIRTIITLIPAAFALWNSDAGLSLGLPSVSMSRTFGTPARPLERTDLALRTAGIM